MMFGYNIGKYDKARIDFNGMVRYYKARIVLFKDNEKNSVKRSLFRKNVMTILDA
jgi:hypothetical protein